jgi:hypothetical protein
MKNCRNCEFAKWGKTESGRRKFWGWAECTYKVVAIVPASRWDADILLNRKVPVYNHDNKPVECAAWSKLESGISSNSQQAK